ncbi:SDR family oxidoreductase [Paenibacillus psychroresistens]|uniref:SDR family oxidoreductase n=1 Tax=Paenibacillus psychroresistens TaxID=1778678 RepID=A0A6B8RJR5_9BACL|nr:SDR family oxidoreductase [Paenibacillus psychroresistens]QGQ95578.1 SDR family oxidoreductase [Paenibacillus psychroresistens]
MQHIFSLSGKVIVITGGSGFLGTTLVEAMVSFGATVVVADRTPFQGTVEVPDRLSFVSCDVSDTGSIREMLHWTKMNFGKIDVLLNGATYGAGYGPAGTIGSMSDEDWSKGLDGAAGTVFRCTREVIPYFEENGGGSIINIASMYGMVSPDSRIYGDSGANNPVNYGAGKAAVIQLTKYCASHLSGKNIRVNCISPGPFPNPNVQQNDDFLEQLNSKTMLGRTGKPKELVGAVILLASEASSFMTGSNIIVDGGWTAW